VGLGFWRLFYVVRVGLLLSILTMVSLWGLHDYAGRRERLDWQRPLEVALVLVQQGPLDAATLHAFRSRIPYLEQQLTREFSKYRQGTAAPIRFYVYGPVTGPSSPQPSESEKLVDQLVQSVARQIHAFKLDRLAHVPLLGMDSRIYIAARPPSHDEKQFAEGFSEQGGRHGFVDVELDPTMVDLGLFVAVHELFHTLGASDKYTDRGTTVLPDGLANPNQQPLFPQEQADVMAHGRPLRPGVDDAPTVLRELGVGPATAREIRWLP
jgi:hypothetical protein